MYIGEFQSRDKETGIIYLRRKKDKRIIKVADLVTEGKDREQVLEYLRNKHKGYEISLMKLEWK